MADHARGFTLIETMLAALVFGIGMVGVVSLYSKTALYSNQSAHLLAATLAASNKIERLSGMSSQQLLGLGGSVVSSADRNGLQPAHPLYSGPFITCTTTLQPTAGSALSWVDLSVTCVWPEGALRSPHSISLAARAVTP